jgi:molybdopterin-guanine dinucleotide biosynthesis protein A
VRDDPEGQGPLGGLRALLLEGVRLGRPVIALACDLPYVTPELVRRLAKMDDANGSAHGTGAVAPRDPRTGLWEPLFARYSCLVCLPVVEGLLSTERRALQAIFDALGEAARELSVTDEERALLKDWDEPEDVG